MARIRYTKLDASATTVQVSLVGGTSRSRLGATRVGTGRSLLRAAGGEAKKTKAAAGSFARPRGGFRKKIPAITDFRARGTIMGPAGLTAVFGMGTGVTPPVWSPEKCPAGGQAGRARRIGAVASRSPWHSRGVPRGAP